LLLIHPLLLLHFVEQQGREDGVANRVGLPLVVIRDQFGRDRRDLLGDESGVGILLVPPAAPALFVSVLLTARGMNAD
jgi:hypothetical protein